MSKICRRLVLSFLIGFAAALPATAYGKTKITYFILAGTMEPLMIMSPEDPMAGGFFTAIIKRVFKDSPYAVIPKVMPWKRMIKEFAKTDNWLMHGIPAFFEPDIPFRLSKVAVFPFNHIAITLRERHFNIGSVQDLFGKTVILVENYHYPGLDKFLDKPLVGTGKGRVLSVRSFKPVGQMRMLVHRRGDVAIGFQPRLLYNMKKAGVTLDQVNFQDVSGIIPTQQMYIAFSPKLPPAFSGFLNERLSNMKSDGTIAKILQKYYAPIGLPKYLIFHYT
jgi:ABC-type amino acid transport substrate-binding protein